MKKIMTAAVAAAVALTGSAAPALANPYHGHDRVVVKKVVVKQPRHHSWRKGDRFDHRYAQNYRVITNPRHYRLINAPRGYRWVQSGHDAVLIGASSGLVIYVMNHVFR
jgi:Ni/Co efflux regulator RcnB